jgi:glycosyltransferase involved in cell wall biosynthesis
MNLLFTVYYPVFGGPHNQALRLDRAMAERGWNTIVLIPSESGNAADRLSSAGMEVVKMRLHRLRAKLDPRLHLGYALGVPAEIKRLRQIIRDRQIDLVVVNGLANPQCALAAHLEKRPVVWQLVDTRSPMLLRRLLMPFVKAWADVVLTTGKRVADLHPGTEKLGDYLRMFFPPVDTKIFRPDPSKRLVARQALGLMPDDVVVGNVSNITPQKDHATFLRAAVELRRAHADARFVILGAEDPNRSDYAPGLWRLASQSGLRLGRELIVRDPGSHVADLAAAFDIFWLTSESKSEGVPTVIEEAMAMALPVVTTNVGAVTEVVEDGVTGFVVKPRDYIAIARATSTLLADHVRSESMGKEARRRAVDRYAIERCADEQLGAFELAIRHRASVGAGTSAESWVG